MTRKLEPTRSPVALIELVTADLPGQPLLEEHSWLLYTVSSYFDLRGYFFLAPGVRKDPSLGTHFEKVRPRHGRQFQLELGVVLPDLFPNLDGQPEFKLSVCGHNSSRDLCFSNVMARLRYSDTTHQLHALMPRYALPQVRAGEIPFVPKDASVELLRTFATSRYEISGDSAEEAYETHVETCIHDMIERLNRCLKAMPFADSSMGKVYSAAYSKANLASFYFLIRGEPQGESGHGWISPHIGRSALNPQNLSTAQAELLKQYVSGTRALDDIESLLYSAQTFLDGGVNEYVLLLSVIAAEVATQRYVQKRLIESSVSKGKVVESEKDLTYSLMLNVVLVALAPIGKKPDRSLLGSMNRARSLRNDYMHDGELPDDPAEIGELFERTKVFVSYLKDLDKHSNGD